MEEALVLYPLPVMGHLISMVELGKLILACKPSLFIHILIINTPLTAVGSINTYISNVIATIPSIKFHHLPTITLPSTTSTKNLESQIFEIIYLSKPHVHQTLMSISRTHTINAIILDTFCATCISIASQLNIPAYFFFTSGVGCLALLLYFPTIHQNTDKNFKDLNTFLDIPGLPPIFSSDLPVPFLDRCNNKAYEYFLDANTCFLNSVGIISNTFELLETRALKAISDGLCVPNSVTPPVYCVGPVIVTNKQTDGGQTECLTWLDSQPNQSVIFLCFGSLGLFSKEQLREIAIGLEKSGERFLWVVRNPPSNDQNVAISPQSDPDLDSLLPDGFLDRTEERGFVVKSWVPQVAVLNHNSVGGFITHCGWNSILEAVCAGVPMVAWPLYAEQRLNRVLMVEEMKIALSMNETKDGFVTSLEVEKRVGELMDSESGNSVRERIISMKNAAKAAIGEGGSSRVALSQLIESWKRH